MNNSPRRSRSNLSKSVHHLSIYVLASGAAFVSLLALTQPSAARIIYTQHNVVCQTQGRGNCGFPIDSMANFTINQTIAEPCFQVFAFSVTVTPTQVPGVVVGTGGVFAAALNMGDQIDSNRNFNGGEIMADLTYFACHFGSRHGYWADAGSRYLGLELQVQGKTHYGWAQMSVAWAHAILTTTLTGYAYETIPGKSIMAGQTKDIQGGAQLRYRITPLTRTR